MPNANRSIEASAAAHRLSVLLLTFLLVPAAANAIVVSVHDITVSNGAVYGNAVVVPVGESVTVGVRVEDPTASVWQGVGLSYYGYDASLIDFVDGLAVPDLFRSDCFEVPSLGEFCAEDGLPNYAGIGYVGDNVELAETAVLPGGALAGDPRVRGMFLWQHVNAVQGTSGAAVGDRGLDGVSGGGDAHIRVTFEAISDGLTSITIGTGDDLGGILIGSGLSTPDATNAEIRLAVPEPGFGVGLACLVGGLIGARAFSRRSDAGPSRRS